MIAEIADVARHRRHRKPVLPAALIDSCIDVSPTGMFSPTGWSRHLCLRLKAKR
jgi:hypothetical protein